MTESKMEKLASAKIRIMVSLLSKPITLNMVSVISALEFIFDKHVMYLSDEFAFFMDVFAESISKFTIILCKVTPTPRELFEFYHTLDTYDENTMKQFLCGKELETKDGVLGRTIEKLINSWIYMRTNFCSDQIKDHFADVWHDFAESKDCSTVVPDK